MTKKIQTKHIIFIMAIALGAMLLLFLPAQSQWVYYWQDKLFSPGQVNYKHMSDRGKQITCQDCHRFGQVLNNKPCVKCHTPQSFLENAPLLADAHQFFNKGDNCLRCHGEHGGAYAFITPVTLNPQQHRQIPFDTQKCVRCHGKTGEKAHLSLVNNKCQNCHDNYSWSSNFDHRGNLSKAKSAQRMLALCQECHLPNHHFNSVIDKQTLTGCIFCHEYWGRRKKMKTIPYPEELFAELKIDPKRFRFSSSRIN